jgi:hypothetical protein
MNQKGFVGIAFLILLPLILAALVVISASSFILEDDAEIRHQCRVQLLRAQEVAAQKLNELIKLNGAARRLRISRKTAELAVVTALNPAAQAIAQAHLDAIILRQAALSAKQKLLVFEGKRASLMGPTNAHREISSSLRRNDRVREASTAGARPRGIRYGLFDVIASPPDSLTPDYQPSPDFAAKQVTRLEVLVAVQKLLPKWLAERLPQEPLQLKINCLATLEKKENKWLATLKADSPRLNL